MNDNNSIDKLTVESGLRFYSWNLAEVLGFDWVIWKLDKFTKLYLICGYRFDIEFVLLWLVSIIFVKLRVDWFL